MNEKEVILDRIKGCLTAVALSDAINNFEKATGKLFLLVRDKPGSQKRQHASILFIGMSIVKTLFCHHQI